MTLVKWSRFANIIERAYLVATCHHISAVHKCLHFKLTKLKNKSILKCCCYGNSCTIKINKNSITKKNLTLYYHLLFCRKSRKLMINIFI